MRPQTTVLYAILIVVASCLLWVRIWADQGPAPLTDPIQQAAGASEAVDCNSLTEVAAAGNVGAPGGSIDQRTVASVPAVGLLPPGNAKHAISFVEGLGIAAPQRLASDEDWQRFVLMVESLRSQMRALGREKNKIGAEIAKRRRALGQREVFPIDSPPTTGDPEWRKKWPWLEAKPGEWRSHVAKSENGVAIVDLVRIQPGEESELDAAQARKDELKELLRLEVESLTNR